MDIGKQKRVIIVEKERVQPVPPSRPDRVEPEPARQAEHGR